MEDYGFEYSDEDLEEQDVDIENNYYNSKGAHAAGCCGPGAAGGDGPAMASRLLLQWCCRQAHSAACT